jgi:hypothetical protein
MAALPNLAISMHRLAGRSDITEAPDRQPAIDHPLKILKLTLS